MKRIAAAMLSRRRLIQNGLSMAARCACKPSLFGAVPGAGNNLGPEDANNSTIGNNRIQRTLAFSFNASFMKSFPIGRGGKFFQLRITSVNVFNHPNFGLQDSTVTDAPGVAGAVTSIDNGPQNLLGGREVDLFAGCSSNGRLFSFLPSALERLGT